MKDITDFIKSQDSIFTAAKYFGGMKELLKIGEKFPEVKEYVNYLRSGNLTFKSDSKQNFSFEFFVIDFRVEDDDHEHIYFDVDLQLPNTMNDEKIGEWVETYMYDMRPEYNFVDPMLNKNAYLWGHIVKVNGKDVSFNAEDSIDVISDFEAQKLMNENSLVFLKKLNTLFD